MAEAIQWGEVCLERVMCLCPIHPWFDENPSRSKRCWKRLPTGPCVRCWTAKPRQTDTQTERYRETERGRENVLKSPVEAVTKWIAKCVDFIRILKDTILYRNEIGRAHV